MPSNSWIFISRTFHQHIPDHHLYYHLTMYLFCETSCENLHLTKEIHCGPTVKQRSRFTWRWHFPTTRVEKLKTSNYSTKIPRISANDCHMHYFKQLCIWLSASWHNIDDNYRQQQVYATNTIHKYQIRNRNCHTNHTKRIYHLIRIRWRRGKLGWQYFVSLVFTNTGYIHYTLFVASQMKTRQDHGCIYSPNMQACSY